MNRLKRRVPWSLLVLSAGCALGPGMHVDEARLVQRYAQPGGTSSGPDFAVVFITTELIAGLSRPPGEDSRVALAVEAASFTKVLASYEYRVAGGDILDVTVWGQPGLSLAVEKPLVLGGGGRAETHGYQVSADGTMFFPYAGLVPVAGQTVAAIRALLTTRLSSRFVNPQLDVRVVAFRGRRVYVTGEVVEPSVLPITDVALTAAQGLKLAKGPTPLADLEHVILTREGKKHRLGLQALYEKGDVSGDWLLLDGDVLTVPGRAQRRVYVLGEVRKPSALALPHVPLSLADALSEAEGVDPATSDPGRIYVFRKGPSGRPEVFRLDAELPDAMLLAAQFPLKSQDVVFVSTHGLAHWNRMAVQVLPSVQTLWQTAALPATVGALIR